MRIVEQSFEILDDINRESLLKKIELAGRVCYKSEDKITEDSASKFVEKIVNTGHHSVIEHVNITVKFITNRGVTHELVRHRIASYSQESTRYVNYNKDMAFVKPHWFDEKPEGDPARQDWFGIMAEIEDTYNNLLAEGLKPQDARGVLPNDLKTEIVVTANLREWKHILTLRTSVAAHPQIRFLLLPLLQKFRELLPEIFA
jgi:thymidylate synthase (FAD)